MTNKSKPCLLTDACVVIDFCKEDVNLLGLASKYLGKVVIPKPIIIREVRQLTLEDCDRLGIRVYLPTEEQLEKAAVAQAGLSERDRLCLRIAIDEGFSLYSNDMKLLKAAEQKKVDAHWGLEILVGLAHKKIISNSEATTRARNIAKRTPYPEEKIMDLFKKRLLGDAS